MRRLLLPRRIQLIALSVMLASASTLSFAQSNRPRFRPPSAEWLRLDSRSPYKIWLDQDVPWIITDEERAAFKLLREDEERDNFIEAFWERRDPTPDTLKNEYKIEHYHRIVYANEQFGVAGLPGWKSDRGRIYIMYGQPDRIESFPAGEREQPARAESNPSGKDSFPRVKDPKLNPADDVTTLPLEVWHYRYIEAIGQNIALKFIDTCRCGDYRMTLHSVEGETLLFVPGVMGQEIRDRASTVDPHVFTGPSRTPTARFLDLKPNIQGRVLLNPLPFEVRADFIKATDTTSLVPVTLVIQNHDIAFVEDHERHRATLNLLGYLLLPNGHVAEEFEDTITLNLDASEASSKEDKTFYFLMLAPRNGHYRLEIAMKDVNANRKGTWAGRLEIQDHPSARLSASSPVLGERIDPVVRDVDATGFQRIGSSYLRPYVGKEGEPLHIPRSKEAFLWMQVYGLAIDKKVHQTSVRVNYAITNAADNQTIFREHAAADPKQALLDQLTLKQKVPSDMKPGSYRLDIEVKDGVSGEAFQRSVAFVVE